MTAHSVSIFAYFRSSKRPPLARTHALRRALHRLPYQLHSVEGHAKYPTVPQRHKLVTGTRAVGQGSKLVSKVICFCKLKNFKQCWS